MLILYACRRRSLVSLMLRKSTNCLRGGKGGVYPSRSPIYSSSLSCLYTINSIHSEKGYLCFTVTTLINYVMYRNRHRQCLFPFLGACVEATYKKREYTMCSEPRIEESSLISSASLEPALANTWLTMKLCTTTLDVTHVLFKEIKLLLLVLLSIDTHSSLR